VNHAVTAPTGDAADEIVTIAARLRVSTTRLSRRLRQESDTDLSPSQLSALVAIDRHGPLTLGALADQERVAPASVTKVVAKLEAAGLVQRRLDHNDRRVAWIHITTDGRARLTRIRRRKDAWLTARVRALGDEDRRRLARALDVLEALPVDAP
jgi:DNA-binding MarR family transcriptional regulator